MLVFYPESAGFYRTIPIDATTSVITGATYRYTGESESMKLAREKSAEIDAEVMLEDKHVCELHFQATASKYWEKGILGDSEKALREHHDLLRALLPEIDGEKLPGNTRQQ